MTNQKIKSNKIIDLDLCKTCPKGYPWICKACIQESYCVGRSKENND